jgi:hypothetical protein
MPAALALIVKASSSKAAKELEKLWIFLPCGISRFLAFLSS